MSKVSFLCSLVFGQWNFRVTEFQKGSWTRFQVVTDTGEMADHLYLMLLPAASPKNSGFIMHAINLVVLNILGTKNSLMI